MEIKLDFDIDDNVIKKILPAAIEKALEISAILVQDAARDLVPVDTGNLKSSIQHEAEKEEAVVYTNVEYGPYVEYGTNKMKSQAYMRPALYNNKKRIVEVFRKVLNDNL